MSFVDLLLNLAGVLLWLSWRAIGLVKPAPAATISSVLKQAKSGRPRRFWYLVGLVTLLALRAVLYWRVGSSVNWIPVLDLGIVSLPFKSISPERMVVFSFASFGLTIGVFYMWLLLISVVNRSVPDTDVWQKLVRLHLGWLQRLPSVFKLGGPPVVTMAVWVLLDPVLVTSSMAARPVSLAHLWQEAALVGLGTLLAWKYLVVLVLFFGVLNMYLYLGNFSFWTFVGATSRNLLKPLQRLPLQVGRIDCSPVLGLALAWLAFTASEWLLNLLFAPRPL